MTRTFDIPTGNSVKRVPVVLAHRGASRVAPDNTLAAFRAAAALGADGVELDARRTADGVVVVYHDAQLSDGVNVVELTAARLRATHPEVPTLEEALDACEGVVNVEIKNIPTEPDYDTDERVAVGVAEMVLRRGLTGRVIVSSFTADALDAVRAVDGRVRTGWLTLPGLAVREAIPLARDRGYDALHPERSALLRDDPSARISAAHEAGLMVNAWTVDDPAEMAALAAAGVDGIITNAPDVARRVVGE